MNQEQVNRLTASLFRQMYLMRVLQVENKFLLQQPFPSGVKGALSRGVKAYENTLTELKARLPLSKEKITEDMKASEEKIMAIANILEKLCMLDEEEVLKLESDFDEHIKIQY